MLAYVMSMGQRQAGPDTISPRSARLVGGHGRVVGAAYRHLDPVADPVVLTPAGARRLQLTSRVGNGVIRVSRSCAMEGFC
jgi:hypothetical protein